MIYSEIAAEMIDCMAFISRETLQMLPRGVAGGEMGILMNLVRDDGEKTPGELSRIMHVSTGRVASALKSLEKKKYIERIQDQNDRRCVTVRLTASGRDYAGKKYMGTIRDVEGIIDCLGEDDAAEAVRILKKVATHLKSDKALLTATKEIL